MYFADYIFIFMSCLGNDLVFLLWAKFVRIKDDKCCSHGPPWVMKGPWFWPCGCIFFLFLQEDSLICSKIF